MQIYGPTQTYWFRYSGVSNLRCLPGDSDGCWTLRPIALEQPSSFSAAREETNMWTKVEVRWGSKPRLWSTPGTRPERGEGSEPEPETPGYTERASHPSGATKAQPPQWAVRKGRTMFCQHPFLPTLGNLSAGAKGLKRLTWHILSWKHYELTLTTMQFHQDTGKEEGH